MDDGGRVKFSIITPTIQRESLITCYESVDRQTFKDWRHITQYDIPPTGDFGNHARHVAWERATGDWILYLDDDCVFSHPNVLSDIAAALEGVEEQWCLFPILRYGARFFNDPPGLGLTDTHNLVLRREIGRWPNIPDYEADGIFVEQLKLKYPYRAFPDVEPIVIMEKSNHGL